MTVDIHNNVSYESSTGVYEEFVTKVVVIIRNKIYKTDDVVSDLYINSTLRFHVTM